MYSCRRVKKFLNLLQKHEDQKIETLMNKESLLTYREIDPDYQEVEGNERSRRLFSLQEAILRLENKLQRLQSDDHRVKRLQRNIERLKGKIKRLEKP